MSVKVETLTKIYGNQKAVDDVSFEAHPGQVLGFLGPNGAGKTTTMKIITCFIPQTAGKAFVCGYDVETHSMEARRRIGYLPESNPLYYDMYVREYLEFAARIYKLGKQSGNRINEMIEVTGLTEERKKKIGQLSKGYKQRVGLAQAMLHDPEVLILDEPTSGLDPNQLTEIRALIKSIGRQKTVILSTHIMQEVKAICDRVIIINKGRLVADDSTENLQQRELGSQTVIVEFKEETNENLLKKIKGVDAVKSHKEKQWILSCNKGIDIRQEVFEFAKSNNLTLLAMQKQESSLEDVFQKLTDGSNIS